MGYNLSLIAFDREPALATLAGLTRFRLFRRNGRSEWYLDGPNKANEVIPLFERPTVDTRIFGEAWTNATQEYSFLVEETKRRGFGSHGLDYKLIPIALMVSSALQVRLLVASGNDEDLDCAFICEGGRFISGRFIVDDEKAMIFDRENGSEIAQLDWSDGQLLYGLVGEVAAEYFGAPDPVSYANEWQEIEARDFLLIDQRN